ncbi:MAG: NUDIX domain-containing protein [Verrucomicrobia bacterium]|nr:NUDIX domain-containing protein [Verrucomicrobiota bacterium]
MSGDVVEQVLCSPAAALPGEWLPESGYLRLGEPELLRVLGAMDPVWLPRPKAEGDPSFKQWIPYVLVRPSGGGFAAYPRRGSESRLHGCWSLGIGGHINPGDDLARNGSPQDRWRALLWNGLRRELWEEFPGVVTGRTRFLGLIHESATAVGRVHIGAVFLHETDAVDALRGPELAGLRWLRPDELGGPEWPLQRFETWSVLALRLASAHLPG